MVDFSLTPELILALSQILYDFAPEILNEVFRVSSKEEMQHADIIHDLISWSPRKAGDIGILLRTIFSVVQRRSGDKKTDLTWLYSQICTKCGTKVILPDTGEIYINSSVNVPLQKEDFVHHTRRAYKHCKGDYSRPVIESVPKLYYLEFARLPNKKRHSHYITAKSHPKIQCIFQGRIVDYSMHCLLIVNNNIFKCSVFLTEYSFYVQTDRVLPSINCTDIFKNKLELLGIIYQSAKIFDPIIGLDWFFTVASSSLNRNVPDDDLRYKVPITFTEEYYKRYFC